MMLPWYFVPLYDRGMLYHYHVEYRIYVDEKKNKDRVENVLLFRLTSEQFHELL